MLHRGRVASLGTVLVGLVVFASACTSPSPTQPPNTLNPAPVVKITATPTSGNAPLTVSFDSAGTTDSNGTVVSYEWTFGDGATATGPTATHTYVAAGSFRAILRATDNGGAYATNSVTITVEPPLPVDNDGDGFLNTVDCDDNDPETYPGAPDPLDGLDKDTNCDGVDGLLEDVILVKAAGGADTTTCGTTLASPCASIAQGQTRAAATGRSRILLAGGTYARFNLQAGAHLRGGYGQNFRRGTNATGSTTTTVNGSNDTLNAMSGIAINGITTASSVRDLTVAAGNSIGRATYGIWAIDSSAAVVIERVTVLGGTAGAGAAGSNGTTASQSPAPGGSPGANSGQVAGCDSTTAGAGGANGGSGTIANRRSGAGGIGGTADGSCGAGSLCTGTDCEATNGWNGTNAGLNASTYGRGGAGGTGAAACTDGAPGMNGRVSDGTPGNGATLGRGTIGSNGLWSFSNNGTAGTVGFDGSGGGGGGGGGGCDTDGNAFGAGGGGGGEGGLRGGAAFGGTQGYASIGIHLRNSPITLIDVHVSLGTGGKGGNGGNTGLGQPGGSGADGGLGGCVAGSPAFGPCTRATTGGGAGGRGGDGGRGGHGGAGGGGSGGPAFGVLMTPGSVDTSGVTFSGGLGGAAGTGGTGPLAAGDGVPGIVAQTFVM